jgi:hypothetical protein
MVDPDITQQMIGSGAELVRKLDASGLDPEAAFWMYYPDIKAWKLSIFISKVAMLGPKDVYAQIQKIIKKYPQEITLSLEDVALIRLGSPLLALLRIAIKIGPGIGPVRFKKNVINGTLIEDAYIYRMK